MKRFCRKIFIMLMTASLLVAQSLPACAEDASLEDTRVHVSLLGKYDSADTASVKQINTYARTIQFRNHDTGKNYTLSYDNTSLVLDIHGNPMSPSRLEIGQVVDITFLKGTKHLNSCVISDYAWVEEGVKDFDLVSDDETAKIKGTVFHITNKTLIISDGQAVNPEDILPTDTIRVSGIDKELYSIVVTRGHGYVSLSSDTAGERSLVGAWIELDKEVIRKITPNMLISAPEGSYNVSIAGNGAKFSSEIVVNRGEETVIDTSVVEVEKIKEGLVTFVATPEESRIFVDGKEVLNEVPHSYTYGKHELHVMAEGYESQDHYLKVAEPEKTLFIELEAKESEKKSSEDSDSSSSNESSIQDVSGNGISEVDSNSSSSNSASKKTPVTSNSAAKKTTRTPVTRNNASFEESSALIDSEAAETTGDLNINSNSSSTSTTSSSSSSSGSSSGNSSSSNSSSSGSSSSDSGNSSSSDSNLVSGCKVTFDEPVGAEVYVDDNYVGVIPVTFAKTSGRHLVTLQKEGYETKSYTILVDKEKTNVTYTFPDLVEEKTDNNNNGGNTGNNNDNNNNSNNNSSGGNNNDSNNSGGNSNNNDNSNNNSNNGDNQSGGNNGDNNHDSNDNQTNSGNSDSTNNGNSHDNSGNQQNSGNSTSTADENNRDNGGNQQNSGNTTDSTDNNNHDSDENQQSSGNTTNSTDNNSHDSGENQQSSGNNNNSTENAGENKAEEGGIDDGVAETGG